MKHWLRKGFRWIGRLLFRFFRALYRFLQQVPGRLKRGIFRFANWGKRQLDKRINTTQRERLHT
ncbi:MAG: hypothetical protein AAFO94_18015, partial [Bacteroidota bacterium]